MKGFRSSIPIDELVSLILSRAKNRFRPDINLREQLLASSRCRPKTGGTTCVPAREVLFRFRSKLSITRCGCWEYPMRKGRKYPVVSVAGRQLNANRLAWVLAGGKLKRSDLVLHTCDNPLCCNPEHLFIGTHQDNSDDKYAKGRQNPIKGEEVNTAKLTEANVRDIKRRQALGEKTQSIRRDYPFVTRHIFQRIKLNRIWKHIK